MGLLVDLHVEVAGRAAARADLALGRQAYPHPVADPGRNLDTDLAPRAHPTVAAAAVTGVRDDLADACAGGARP